MKSFLIQGALQTCSLEFLERTPTDPCLPIERFKVRISDQDLAAVGRIYIGSNEPHPADLFAQMAARWAGWQDALTWESLDGALSLRCVQDRNGHVAIRADLRSGPTDRDWTVTTTIQAEAGQLEELARAAALFFGRSGTPSNIPAPA
jgi:hypothetical protein